MVRIRLNMSQMHIIHLILHALQCAPNTITFILCKMSVFSQIVLFLYEKSFITQKREKSIILIYLNPSAASDRACCPIREVPMKFSTFVTNDPLHCVLKFDSKVAGLVWKYNLCRRTYCSTFFDDEF
jgi:hypothetical protein